MIAYEKRTGVVVSGVLLCLFAVGASPASAMYLPAMPPSSGNFGTAVSASASFQDGYHWDDLSTPEDEREIPTHYTMPSPMPGYTAGDALDWHWVWVGILGDYVIWDFGAPVFDVRVYPSQDHGPYTGPNSEFDEYTVYGSNDQITWTLATQLALYCDDITNVRTHDGVKDYTFGGARYRYVKIASAIDHDFELDAVEALSIVVEIDIKPGSYPNSINPGSKGVIPVAILSTEDFDASTVEPETVRFGPDAASAVQSALEDVDGDGDLDMILHFKTQDTGIKAGDTEATLTGETIGGIPLGGTDSVRTVPKGKK